MIDLPFRQLYSGMRSDYLRCNRIKTDEKIEWYQEAWQMREFCDEGYYEIGDDGRLYKLYRPDPTAVKEHKNCVEHLENFDEISADEAMRRTSDKLEVREDLNYNGIIEFYGNHRQLDPTGNRWAIDTYQAQFLNGQLIAIWKKHAFGDIITSQEEWDKWEAHRRWKRERTAKLAAMSPTEREAFLEAERIETERHTAALGGLLADAIYTTANRKGFMRSFLEKH